MRCFEQEKRGVWCEVWPVDRGVLKQKPLHSWGIVGGFNGLRCSENCSLLQPSALLFREFLFPVGECDNCNRAEKNNTKEARKHGSKQAGQSFSKEQSSNACN